MIDITPTETALLFDGIRHPGMMRHVMEKHLSELIHELLRSEVEGDPDLEIYVENSVIELVTIFRPMLLATVNDFFDLRWSPNPGQVAKRELRPKMA